MKIDKPGKPLPPTAMREEQVRPPNAKAAHGGASTGATSGSHANLNATSTQLQSSVVHTPLVDTAKVAEIKQAITENRFQVNTAAVADGLIKSVTDLIKAQKH